MKERQNFQEINSLIYVDITKITNNFENYKVEEIISAISSISKQELGLLL